MTGRGEKKKVVYLFGAGASHGCVQARGGAHGILMRDLGPQLAESVKKCIQDKYQSEKSLLDLANAVIDEETDFEHVITFLDESPSNLYRRFASDLREIFERVLRKRLGDVKDEFGKTPSGLYEAVLDMYQVQNCPEELVGLITLNYDEYIEDAIQSVLNWPIDFGVDVRSAGNVTMGGIKLLKLHGSFGWRDMWPIERGTDSSPLWIPPGIQKAKDRYPFNVLWGAARELLNCDVLRIVGCKLGPNDWDLISLLFTTKHTRSTHRPYVIEIIDSPGHAAGLKRSFPYLDVRSILEIEPVGRQLISEILGGGLRQFNDLRADELQQLQGSNGTTRNWFQIWLKQMAEAWYEDLGSVTTKSGVFEQLMEAY